MEYIEDELATVSVNLAHGKPDEVLLEITDGVRVLLQLKKDGTLLLHSKIHIAYSDDIKSMQIIEMHSDEITVVEDTEE